MDYFSADANARINVALIVCFAFCVLLLARVCPTALADGGVVQLHQSSGPFVITVFTAPTPLRAGTADISVMVQDSQSDSPLLDANVIVSLYSEDGKALKAEARRALSRNMLLYSALLILPEAGRWTIEVTVRRNSDETRIGGTMTVAARESSLLANWWALALPPATIILFMLNQWLKSRKRDSPRIFTDATDDKW